MSTGSNAGRRGRNRSSSQSVYFEERQWGHGPESCSGCLKPILQSGSIGKAAPSYGELCRFESGLCNRAPYTNTVRWPGFQPGDTGSSPVGVIYMDSWPTGRGSRLKPGKGSFDSNTVHLRAWCMCMRMVQLRAQGLCAFVWINYVRMVWDQFGLQLLTWMVRIHLCTSCLIRSIGEDRGLLILQYGFESCMRHPGM